MSNINLNFKGKNINLTNCNVNSSSSFQPEGSETRSRKKMKSKREMPNEEDKVLEGFNSSVGTIIKQKANDIYNGKQYHKLNNSQKTTVCNGFNSILDLANNDDDKDSQRKLFNDKEWRTLNGLYNKVKAWDPIDKQIQLKLMEIEALAAKNIKAAYKRCLFYQSEYAFEEEESFFSVYSHILKLLNDKKKILKSSTTEKFSEEDYIVHVWAKIFSSVFEDKNRNIFCKWGESVPEGSSETKKKGNNSNDFTIGDKIDLRVCFRSPGGRVVDLVSVEFAKDGNDDKFFSDHRKVLREAKNNADRFYKSGSLKTREKRTIRGFCIQIAGTEGQICQTGLVDEGLYVGTRLGSLRLPSVQTELRYARVLLERLGTLKADISKQILLFEEMENNASSIKRCMEKKQGLKRSPYDDPSPISSSSPFEDSGKVKEKYTNWVRGSWFPPSVRKDSKYDGEWPPYLFSPPE